MGCCSNAFRIRWQDTLNLNLCTLLKAREARQIFFADFVQIRKSLLISKVSATSILFAANFCVDAKYDVSKLVDVISRKSFIT